MSVSAESVYHGLYTAPFDRFVNLRFANVTNPIVYHGVSRAYYQKVLQVPSGVYYMYYSDINVTSGLTMTSVANSTNGNTFKFVRYAKFSGHPYVVYSADGFGINNNYILWSWDEVTVGKISPYKKSIRLYYGNNSDLTSMKDMGWVNFTWMMGTSNNGTISGTYGINKMFYNASGNGFNNTVKNPFGYKFVLYFECAGGSAENFCLVGSDDPTKFFKKSLYKTLINDTPGAWDNLKLGYGDVIKYKGYNLLWYEGGVADTRIGTGLAYSLNGTKFTRLVGNPILKKSSSPYLNLSVGGASLLIEGYTARLYIAGRNFTGGSYQILQYLYDIRTDKNITITGVTGASSQIMNRTNGVLYNYNASGDGDKVLLLTGLKYNIKVKPDAKNTILINGLNGSNARDMEIRVQTASSNPSGIQSLSSVIYSNVTGFDIATLYFNKSVIPDKVCSCASWNTVTKVCDSSWVCNATGDYQFGFNSTQYWINVTHFSGYALGNNSVYSAPSISNIALSSASVLQGRNVNITVTVASGANPLSYVSFSYNNTLGDIMAAVEGGNVFAFSTSGKLGSYVIGGAVNDSNNTLRTYSGPSLNIYTTTTTTTTTSSSTTTTIKGSLNIVVSGGGSVNTTGSVISVTAGNGTVIVNSTTNQTSNSANTSVLTNAVNYSVKVVTPSGEGVKLNGYDFTKVDSEIKVQSSNLTGVKPVVLRKFDNVISSNASSFKVATLVFNMSFNPNYICRCTNWNYITSVCNGGGWVCNSTLGYQKKFTGNQFMINVSHFSAYVVGSGDQLMIWDDTNDPQGQHLKHYGNDSVGFFANYTNSSGSAIDGGAAYCHYKENSAGIWSTRANMTYNSTSKLYYIYKGFGNFGDFDYNITCFSVSYNSLSVVDDFVISRKWMISTLWSQVYWWTAEVVAHSIRYGIYNASLACDQMHLFYVDGVTGSLKRINASTDKTGQYKCQNSTQGAFVLQNDGSVSINVSAAFDQVTSGVTMKLSNGNDGWQSSCSGVCDSGGCDLSGSCLMVNVTPVLISHALQQNSSKEFWMWADFNHVKGTVEPTKGNMTTIASKS